MLRQVIKYMNIKSNIQESHLSKLEVIHFWLETQQEKLNILILKQNRYLTKLLKLKLIYGDKWTYHTTIISYLGYTNDGKYAVSTS